MALRGFPLITRRCTVLVVMIALAALWVLPVQAHAKQVVQSGDYEITYFSDPADPIADSPATLYIQVRNITDNSQFRVYHFLVQMIAPSGPRVIQHPLSNSTVFTFDQPGNWLLLFEIGLSPDLGSFEVTASFVADVSQPQTSGLLAAFAMVLAVAIPKSLERWGHIVAVVLWLGTMLHVANTYRLSFGRADGVRNFARAFREADIIVAIAVGLLILTGVLRAFAHGLTTVGSLFQSDFGLVLFVKIVLASGMIIVGVSNRTYMLKKLDAAASKSDTSSVLRAKTLARRTLYLVILEMGFGVTAILFGTVFTQIHTIS